MVLDIQDSNIPNLKVPASPVKFSNPSPTIRNYPPLLCEHTKEILKSLGYQEEQIREFRNHIII